jgi:hypothetical protein
MQDEIPKHRRKRGRKKPWVIEWRWLKPGWPISHEWCTYSRYETEQRREQAWLKLAREDRDWWEYRKVDPCPP